MHMLKTLRDARGLYQKDIAKAIGVDRTTYVKYERGDSEPNLEMIGRLADFFGVSVDFLMGRESDAPASSTPGSRWVPVLGKVVAGVPIEAIEEVLDYEEVSAEMARTGEYFALQINGDSMEPRIKSGDVVIVRKQNDCENGDIAVVLVNGEEATVKRIKKRPEGVMLIPMNTNYEPIFYPNKDLASLSVVIIGKVVELRAKF